MNAFRIFAGALFRRSRMERDMSEELAAHIELRADDLIRSGCSRADAIRRARIEFGGVENYKESCRQSRGLAWFDELRGNVRFTLRSLRASPGYALAAILSLAVGIGANLCAFVSVNAVVLHPFPFPHLDRIMLLGESNAKFGGDQNPVAPGNFRDWKTSNRSFEYLAAFRGWDALLNGTGEPERVRAALVSADYFAVLGMLPVQGRMFTAREFESGADGVIVISRSFQQRHLVSIGQTFSLDGRPHTVIAVMPGDFDFPLATEIWAPLAYRPKDAMRRDVAELGVVGRLKPGVSVDRARSEMSAVASTLAKRYPQTNEARGVSVRPLGEMNEVTDRFVFIVWCAAGFVLLLACANIANLQLARFTARQKEMGLRAALGASRLRLVRQVLTESLLIAIAGGIAGLYIAFWETGIMKRGIPAEVLRWVAGLRHLEMTPAVLAFGFATSIGAGLACALPSIHQLLRRRPGEELNEVLKEAGRGTVSGRAGNRARTFLVAGEVSLALVLVVGAVLMVRTFERMLAVNAGIDPKGVLTLEVTPSPNAYGDAEHIAQFYDRVLEEMGSLSGVQSAGLSGSVGAAKWEVAGREAPAPEEPRPDARAISSGYFHTMRIPLIGGRSIEAQDGPGSAPALVVSESVARYYWRGSSPVGQRVRLNGPASPWLTVVGVCGDVRDWFGGQPESTVYVSYRQQAPGAVRFVLRTDHDPVQSASAARMAVRRVDGNQAVYNVKSMEQILAEQTSGVRSAAMVMSIDAAIALLLALMGSYAVSSFFVAQRIQEIGVRVALGASPRTIVGMVVGQMARIGGLGLLAGLLAALGLCTVMSHTLYHVVTLEPLTFVALTAGLAASTLLAAYVPALRAARIDPVIALRSE